MHIDGKNITKLSQPNAVSKANKASSNEVSKSNGELNHASDFALKHNGIDQTQRLSNDKVTQLQSRKQTLEKGVEKLERDAGAEISVANELNSSGLFSGTDFEQKLNSLVSDKASSGSIQQAIKTEINAVSQGISQEVQIHARSDDQPEQLIQELRERLRDNPQVFQQAHAGASADTVNGLLGNNAV